MGLTQRAVDPGTADTGLCPDSVIHSLPGTSDLALGQ